jgi:hypothetical protein
MAAWKAATLNNLKGVGLAGHNFHDDHGALPPWTDAGAATVAGAENPAPSWLTASLPYTDRAALYSRYQLARPYDDPANAAVVAEEVEVFVCYDADYSDRSAEGGYGLAHFAGNVRLLGDGGPRTFDGVTDGLGSTLYAGQIGGFPKPWSNPSNLRDPAAGFGGEPERFGGSVGGGAFLTCDGSVHFIYEGIDPEVLNALATPGGGEEIKPAR